MTLGKVFYLRAYGAMLIALLMAAAVAVLTLPHERERALKHHCEMVQIYRESNGESGWPDYNRTGHMCPKEK